ncbi:LLM class flavin-dependent oxidoreductase [Oharaeibacter diazotrophicus]|uniref:Alkanesulfonate monooxygenase SsuD/methylene tetrahydromethanopterin reductase-like flavin-dependent oxidoreductase (Luciferase family) n=1 Tax=Oharaeibacter diazotrophicus TaxID=1920512 RepID=A0A4R6RL33_9HYPH|nr:LLM class flavin-dependent oxidoreductase [Oharaeibacter diazotrophicus]TDP87214.1 alkanesulfonate monooxygenase SsuD/methylene tetrahydromethanopterin reductase-like flavin-dependent oxidoreductase (luciferase family) [Oharaeibacter diazotrophicus]BBE70843.1 pyrimidine monooxygenase RutA [Pleomorphomonas sp. SM30]GLS77592.1 alkanesulfonate monooxygenase [Oharaeibacter diazotrophicus]
METTTNPMFAKGRFLLGTFSTNCSGGMTVTKVPERWVNSFDNNLKLARLLDDAGIDFMLPIARWIGYGGETDFHGSVLETMTWAAGLLAHTSRLAVFATIHTAANNPVVVAKQIATIDQIGKGRAGLNIVAGWNKPEYEALGLTLPDDHETRYGYAQEWFDVIRKLWTSTEHFDWNGKYFTLKGVKGDPRPLGDVPIINAAGSPQGRDFATRNANFLFTPAIDLARSTAEIGELKAQAASVGRSVDVLTFSHVICRPTREEAEAYLQYTARDNADWAAVDNLVRLQFAHAHSFPHDLLALIRDRMAAGHGGFPLIGTPEDVANGLVSLAEAGFAGTTLSFVDYAEEFPYFRDTVLPILAAKDLR